MRFGGALTIAGRPVLVDGYNVLITLETAIDGGPIVRSDDGFLRDLSETHGAYRENETTTPAIAMINAALAELRPSKIEIYLDRPVAFSGRLRDRLGKEIANVEVFLEDSADGALKRRITELEGAVLASADSVILREAGASVDLVAAIVERSVPSAWLIDVEAAPCRHS